MCLKTPKFWYGNLSLAALALAPFSLLYLLGHKLHQRSKTPQKAQIPVICIGNLNAGGSGKTPVALSVMALVRGNKLAVKPFFLTRGYGRDEDKILSRAAPTMVGKNRVQAAQNAAAQGSDLIIMDDGLQNPSLHKDIKFVVIDGAMGFGNRLPLPAGPLRQTLRAGFQNADAFILIGEDKKNILKILPKNKPCFTARLEAVNPPPRGGKYFAFAGLGYPQKFFDFLKQLGVELAGTKSFPDHYHYKASDIRAMKETGAALITTEKDFIKIPQEHAQDIHVLNVRLKWDDEAALSSFIKKNIKK